MLLYLPRASARLMYLGQSRRGFDDASAHDSPCAIIRRVETRRSQVRRRREVYAEARMPRVSNNQRTITLQLSTLRIITCNTGQRRNHGDVSAAVATTELASCGPGERGEHTASQAHKRAVGRRDETASGWSDALVRDRSRYIQERVPCGTELGATNVFTQDVPEQDAAAAGVGEAGEPLAQRALQSCTVLGAERRPRLDDQRQDIQAARRGLGRWLARPLHGDDVLDRHELGLRRELAWSAGLRR